MIAEIFTDELSKTRQRFFGESEIMKNGIMYDLEIGAYDDFDEKRVFSVAEGFSGRILPSGSKKDLHGLRFGRRAGFDGFLLRCEPLLHSSVR